MVTCFYSCDFLHERAGEESAGFDEEGEGLDVGRVVEVGDGVGGEAEDGGVLPFLDCRDDWGEGGEVLWGDGSRDGYLRDSRGITETFWGRWSKGVGNGVVGGEVLGLLKETGRGAQGPAD